MIDSTNPRVMADNIRHLSGESGSQASDILALQTTVTAQGNAIEALGYYSTDEVNTGEKFLGSDIFRKVFTIESLPNNDTITIPHNVSDIGTIVLCYGSSQTSNLSAGRTIPYSNQILVRYNSTNIVIQSTIDMSGSTGVVILEYTKAAPSSLTSPAPDDSRSIEPEVIEDFEEIPEEEPVVETKTTTRKKSTSTK